MSNHRPATLLAQADHFIDEETGAVTPPVYYSSTFARDEHYEVRARGARYSRTHNPTSEPAERLIAKLEGGAQALLFGSGLAAATALFASLTHGERVAVPRDMYHGLRDWLLDFSRRWGLVLDVYDGGDLRTLARIVKPGETKLVWVETPANPTWSITDIAGSAEIAHDAGALLGVDSTVATPMLTRPIEHGADFVFHSATKYLNGHSDLVAGVLVCKELGPLWESVRFQRGHGGAVLGPMEVWLLLRGMRTLHLRMRQACENADQIARFLAARDDIEQVMYPGLEDHPGYEIARKQMQGGFGAVVSFLVKGDADTARAVASGTRLFVPATSLGGVESLIEHRASVEGPNSPVAPNLVRLSVGIEHADDLLADLDQALAGVKRAR